MPDLAFTPLPTRDGIRADLRRVAPQLDPPLRVLAEDVLGEQCAIDLLAVDPHGCLVLLLVADAGDDARAFTRALAQREWVRSRVADWMKLAPGLALRTDAEIRVLLLAPSFAPETLAAAHSEAARAVDLAQLRAVTDGTRVFVLIDPIETDARGAGPAAPPPAPVGAETSAFRTGLTERELGLEPDELRELQ